MNDRIDEQTGLSEEQNVSPRRFNPPGIKFNGFVNEIRAVPNEKKTLYFARLGLISGREDDGQGGYRNFIQNVDLLLSSRLEKWAALIVQQGGLPQGYGSLLHQLEVSGLQFTPVIVDGKAYLNTRGFLESISLGNTL